MTEQTLLTKTGQPRQRAPGGGRKPAPNKLGNRTVRMSNAMWAICEGKPGGASEYIRQLIKNDIEEGKQKQ